MVGHNNSELLWKDLDYTGQNWIELDTTQQNWTLIDSPVYDPKRNGKVENLLTQISDDNNKRQSSEGCNS